MRRIKGVCPPSKPRRIGVPLRAFCPLPPFVDVPPLPEPRPRPRALELWVEPRYLVSVDNAFGILLLHFNCQKVLDFIDLTAIGGIIFNNLNVTNAAKAQTTGSVALILCRSDQTASHSNFKRFSHK